MDVIKDCKLPDTLSALIEQAIADLVKCERDPGYHVLMTVWHEASHTTCAVCLAGAVMAQTCGADRSISRSPHDYPEVTKRKLRSLEMVRNGSIHAAIWEFHGDMWPKGERPLSFAHVLMPSYRGNEAVFKEYALHIAARLREAGY
jgi:hypothetical protein